MGFYSNLKLVAAGTVLPWGTNTPPTGWLLCDGSAVSRLTYVDLYNTILTTHGQGDGTTTFNIPDYRGRFLRGTSGSATTDPDKAGRGAMNAGGDSGNSVGSIQGTALTAHSHGWQVVLGGPVNSALSGSAGTDSFSQTGFRPGASNGDVSFSTATVAGSVMALPISSTTGESRPINAYTNFIIKY